MAARTMPCRPHRRGRCRRVCAAAVLLLSAAPALALEVFACHPEWAALTRQLAPQAQVRSATHARQDPHQIEARPSLIAALRAADLAVCTGAGLESGWLPMLRQRAANPRVQPGTDGLFEASDHVALIDPRPPGLPWDGDVHPEGNPHLHLDPQRLLEVARALADTLTRLEPAQAAQTRQALAAFERDWQARIAGWQQRAAPLRGLRVAAQHTGFAYLFRWLGVQQVADLEPKPGMPPSTGHLQRVLEQVRAAPPRAVVVAWHHDPRPAQWLAAQLDVPLLRLPATVPDPERPDALAEWMDGLIDALLAVTR